MRLQCYEGIDATQALYDWDFPRQILHLRALEAAGGADPEEAEKSLYDERFLLARPVLAALQQSPVVLLVDEVDRADDEFEAFLLEVLSTYQVSIPELGTIRAATPPVVVLTSNRTRELHDALKRRCLYHWIDHPGLEREVAIVRSRAPEVSATLARQVVGVVQQLRGRDDLEKPPGVAETLDWARALQHLGTTELDLESAARTLGALVKYREDADRVRQALDRLLRAMIRQPDEILLGFARALRAAGVPVTQDRAHGFLAAAATGRARRPAGDVHRRTGDAVLLARRPGPLRPGVRGLLQRPRRDCPGPARRHRPRRRSTDLPATDDEGGGAGESDAEPVRAMASRTEVLRHRDVASLSAGGAAPARRDVRDPAPPAAAAAYGAPPALAPRRGRRLPHPAGQPAPDGRAGRRSSGAAARSGRAGWCCWSTCPAR